MTTETVYLWTPISWLGLTYQQQCLRSITFEGQGRCQPIPIYAIPVAQALYAYFENPRVGFSIDLKVSGTPFQQKVWHALAGIPLGQTKTYGELAIELASSARAVGQTLRRNPFPILIPCHRVVAKTGIGGFAGATDGPLTAIKAWLLSHEKV